MNGVYSYELNGVALKTGDIICTTDGSPMNWPGQFWRIVGKLIPGKVDHIVVYVGPGGRCVESGANRKVSEFEIPAGVWNAEVMYDVRLLMDELFGIADPVAGRDIAPEDEERIRLDVAEYCLAQAAAGKPYNLNFFDRETEEAFYCSQLAYKAYQRHHIILDTPRKMKGIPGSQHAVFPQEVWECCRLRHEIVEWSPGSWSSFRQEDGPEKA